MSADESWLPVVGYEGYYEVSDQGRVRSLNRLGVNGNRLNGKVLKQHNVGARYLGVDLWKGGKPHRAYVHHLVLEAFVGPRPDGQESRHGEGGSHDNSVANLSWGTHSENILDQIEHGTHINSRKTHCKNGHAFTPENTRRRLRNGRTVRDCITCHRANASNRYYAMKEAA